MAYSSITGSSSRSFTSSSVHSRLLSGIFYSLPPQPALVSIWTFQPNIYSGNNVNVELWLMAAGRGLKKSWKPLAANIEQSQSRSVERRIVLCLVCTFKLNKYHINNIKQIPFSLLRGLSSLYSSFIIFNWKNI